MRHAQGGGLTAERREFREGLRLQAAERFTRDETNTVIARVLRVSVRSVQRWRRAWREGGTRAWPRPARPLCPGSATPSSHGSARWARSYGSCPVHAWDHSYIGNLYHEDECPAYAAHLERFIK
jgi:hypothetical protein